MRKKKEISTVGRGRGKSGEKDNIGTWREKNAIGIRSARRKALGWCLCKKTGAKREARSQKKKKMRGKVGLGSQKEKKKNHIGKYKFIPSSATRFQKNALPMKKCCIQGLYKKKKKSPSAAAPMPRKDLVGAGRTRKKRRPPLFERAKASRIYMTKEKS